jgi:hypothetical protein
VAVICANSRNVLCKALGARVIRSSLLATIGEVLDEIRPERQLAGRGETVTIISASYGGRRMTGVIDETEDSEGRVLRATLLLRPLSALREAIGGMQATLERAPLPSTPAPAHDGA